MSTPPDRGLNDVHGTFAQGVGLAFYMLEEAEGLAAEGNLEKGLDDLP
jgi:hypothetical protein